MRATIETMESRQLFSGGPISTPVLEPEITVHILEPLNSSGPGGGNTMSRALTPVSSHAPPSGAENAGTPDQAEQTAD